MTPRQLFRVCIAISIVLHFWILQSNWSQSTVPDTGHHIVTMDFDVPYTSADDSFSLTAGVSANKPKEQSEDVARRLKRLATKKFMKQVRAAIERQKFSSGTEDLSDLIGNVRYSFTIKPDDTFSDIQLLRSSGDCRLDTAAHNAISIASGRTKRPTILKNESFSVSITIKYQYNM